MEPGRYEEPPERRLCTTLAAVHHGQRRNSEAAELYEQAFDIRLKAMGAAHPPDLRALSVI